jgi:hypothetical protein
MARLLSLVLILAALLWAAAYLRQALGARRTGAQGRVIDGRFRVLREREVRRRESESARPPPATG